MLETCDMVELASKGNQFTWAGKRYDLWIQSRLDRVFGNKEWFSHFPASNQRFLDMRGSDHKPVLLKLMDLQEEYRGHFRFDRRLLYKPNVEEAIAHAWGSSSVGVTSSVSQRLRLCRKALSAWKRTNTLNAKETITRLETDLEFEVSSSFPRATVVSNIKRELAAA
ncbi:PREDICTED: uncharacterized protein LOC104704850 [Camelina sativa]|uniref:Uncharacterized protein LOC104704850 n=1 Tax=Camelina sativa TaxID=90675 RepID=A0ABM0T0Z4_CAMSA|nr:PREDICTED: uncharacterized protein LOC104704850 [Camelina sativa]